MDSIEVSEVGPGEFRLYLIAGTMAVDDTILELGHEPNGPFWEGIVELLVATEAPELDGHFWTDAEAGALLVHSGDRGVLDDLAVRLRGVAADGNRLRQLVELAASRGYGFDD